MTSHFSTIGYGLLLEETVIILDAAIASKDANQVKALCLEAWPQKSQSNKEKLWQHLKYRFLDIDGSTIRQTPLLEMFKKVRNDDRAVQDLIFFQLCTSTPILLETLSLIATDSFLNTGEAVFSRYHLDQLLESKYDRVPQSTRDRVRSILVKAGRLKLSKSNYSVVSYCPEDAVLGYSLYHDASQNGWRAPSTVTVVSEGTITPIFMCNRPLLIAAVNKLATKGHCEYQRHGSTDQIQLIHQTLEEYVNAWK